MFQLEGFCAWTVAQTDGALIRGNSKLGLLEYKSRVYAFSSAEVAHKWAREPDKHLIRLYNTARSKPSIVKLLNLLEDLESVSSEDL